MKISIITPSYNQGQFIGQTIQSVIEQVSSQFLIEFIIVDAVSTDNTAAVVQDWLPKLEAAGISCRFVCEPDKGQSDAINKGWRLATGDILTYLNSDDYYLPQSLVAVARFFKDHPDCQWAYGGWSLVNRAGLVYCTIQPKQFSHKRLLYNNNIGQPSCFFRRKLLEVCGGLREEYHLAMDYDLWLRFATYQAPGIISAIIGQLRYYGDTKSAAQTYPQLKEIYRINSRYTKPLSWRRFGQIFSFCAGLVVYLLRIDITRRIEYFTQLKNKSAQLPRS